MPLTPYQHDQLQAGIIGVALALLAHVRRCLTKRHRTKRKPKKGV